MFIRHIYVPGKPKLFWALHFTFKELRQDGHCRCDQMTKATCFDSSASTRTLIGCPIQDRPIRINYYLHRNRGKNIVGQIHSLRAKSTGK